MILIRKGQWPILITNLLALLGFTLYFASRANYEFLIYVGVILFFLAVILATNRRVEYPNSLLWGLTLWALLHMSGGSVCMHGKLLYEIILIPISAEYGVFRFDQFVHIVGFGVATLAVYHLLKPLLKPDVTKWTSLSIVVVMAGLGVGALNEIVEFTATILCPETGVGGYLNTSLDLVADFIGAVLALVFIRIHGAAART